MDFYEVDAIGPIRMERLTGSTPPTFSDTTDIGRVLYMNSTGYLYYGDGVLGDWVKFNDVSLLTNHILSSEAHNASGAIIGATTLSEHTTASSAHNSNGNVAGKTDVDTSNALLTTHVALHTTIHGVSGSDIAGLGDITTISNSLTAHAASDTAHGANGTIVDSGDVLTSLTNHVNNVSAHPLASMSAPGYMRALTGVELQFINGLGEWAAGPTGIPGPTGSQGPQGSTGPQGTNGTNGTNGRDGSSGTSGASGASGISGVSGADGTRVLCTSGTSGTSPETSTFSVSLWVPAGRWTFSAWHRTRVMSWHQGIGTLYIDNQVVDYFFNPGDTLGPDDYNTSCLFGPLGPYVMASDGFIEARVEYTYAGRMHNLMLQAIECTTPY